MGQTLGTLQNSMNGMSEDVSATLAAVTNTVNGLRDDASSNMINVANECVESLRILIQETERTTFLLTNGLLALMTAIAFSIFLYLTQFSPLLRAIVWTMYASLCLHMLMTYIRHSHSREQRPISPKQQKLGQKLPLQSKFLVKQKVPKYKSALFSYIIDIQYKNQRLEIIMAQSKTSSEIDLTGVKLNNEDIAIVVSQVINNPQCTSLKLISNQITSNSALVLADALLNNKTLQRLSLWKNQVGDTGVQSLSNTLSINRSALKQLDLSQNNITDVGAKYLAEMLTTNKVLTHLTLSNNNISDKGVQLLANALKNRNQTLQVLSLTENKLLTDASIHSLIDMIKSNRSLQKLWINDCNLSKQGKKRLQRARRADLELHL